MCLGFEPGATKDDGWKAQMNPLSYLPLAAIVMETQLHVIYLQQQKKLFTALVPDPNESYPEHGKKRGVKIRVKKACNLRQESLKMC